MKILISVIVVVLILTGVFVAVNWNVLTTQTLLSFVFFNVQAPMGIILLGIALGLVVLTVIYAMLLRTSGLIESRQLNRQLQEQRELAEKAETSRFTDLHKLIEQEFTLVHKTIKETNTTVIAHNETFEQYLTKHTQEMTNTILANIGYIDDELKRILPAGSEPENPKHNGQ
ncbi:MAG: hypothetical protein U9N55_04075 [candidate division Zixibacteria bacterium]|nr:hypothetical protein [candidate division Zixibacteria bacterium]